MPEFLIGGTTVSLSAAVSTVSTAVRTNADPNQAVRVVNTGVSVAWVKRGNSTVQATVGDDLPILPQAEREIVPLGPTDTHMAAVATVTCKLFLTPGSLVR